MKMTKKRQSANSLYVGKAFLLKGFKEIRLHTRAASGSHTNLSPEEKSGVVVILKEASLRVHVVTAAGRTGWLSRTYLKSDVSQPQAGESDTERLPNLIARLAMFYDNVKGQVDKKHQRELVDIIIGLKNLEENNKK